MRHLRLFLLAVIIPLLACSGMDMKEAQYRNNLASYTELIARASPALQLQLTSKRGAYEKAHAALPSAKADRLKALETLNNAANSELKKFEARVEAEEKTLASANAAAIAGYKATFVGSWEGDGMYLRIGKDDSVTYKRKKGNVSKSLDGASIKAFRQDSFDVSLLGMGTTFKIDKAPALVGGTWEMTIDGAQLKRTAP